MDDKIDKAPISGTIQHLAQPLAHAAQAVLTTMGVALSPVWTIPIVSAFGLYGFYLFYKQDELNKFMNWIKEHPDEFAEEVVQQPAFQDGFIITLVEYLKARSEEKRDMIKSIFLGFTTSEKKGQFDLERYYQTMEFISYDGINYLKFLQEEIIPDWQTFVASEMQRLEWQRNLTEKSEPLSKYITKWIEDNYNPNTDSVKKRWGYIESEDTDNKMLGQIFAEEAEHKHRRDERISEYVSLGLLKPIPGSSGGYGGGGSPTEYTLTDYGWGFIGYLNSD